MSRARVALVVLALAVFVLIALKPKHRLPVNSPAADTGVEPAGLQPHPISANPASAPAHICIFRAEKHWHGIAINSVRDDRRRP
jgi:hypothetical protein